MVMQEGSKLTVLHYLLNMSALILLQAKLSFVLNVNQSRKIIWKYQHPNFTRLMPNKLTVDAGVRSAFTKLGCDLLVGHKPMWGD